MTDEELCKGLRLLCFIPTTQAADRIEALTAERDEHWKSFVHWRKEADALTEQLEAARADAKEAEAYAEGLEKERDEWKSLAEAAIKDDASKNIYYAELKAKLATCEKCRDAYAECDSIGTQAVRDLEAKLAECLERNALLEARLGKVVEGLLLARVHVANNEQGWSVGRASARSDLKIINALLAEIEGLSVKQTG